MSSRYDTLKARFESAAQGHVFAFWNKLSSSEQETLLNQLETINVDRVNAIYAKAIKADEEARHASPDSIDPLPAEASETLIDAPQKEEEYRAIGLKAVAENRVAVLLMAGGQGTRLGSSDPKGCYDIRLPSRKPLFQLQAERIRRLQTVAECAHGKKTGDVKIRWYIMTSEPTHDATRAFFGCGKDGRKLNTGKLVNFGLDDDQVVFFKQSQYMHVFSSIK